MKTYITYICFLILILLIGCATVTTVPVSDNSYPAHDNEIIFFDEEEDIDRAYEKISIIMAKTDIVSDSKMIKKIKSEAQSIGADAVIFQDESYSAGYMSVAKSFRVLAIKFID